MQEDPSRTEKATPKRLRKARDQGSVPKSQELSKGVMLLFGLIGMYIFIHWIGRQLMTVFILFFKTCMEFNPTTDEVYGLFIDVSVTLAKMLLPFLLLLGVVAYITMRLQVGPLWTTQHMFKFNIAKHFNIIAGLKRLLISPQALVRLARNILQATVIAIAPYIVLKNEFGNMAPLFYQNAEGITAYILGTGATMVKYTLGPILAIGIADLIYTRWDYNENLKMTKFEV